MQFQPDYTIELKEGGKVPLLFNNWGFIRLSEKMGVEHEDLACGCLPDEKEVNGEKVIEPGKTLRSKNYPAILLMGAETFCRYNNISFTHTDLDANAWVDDLGWYNSPQMSEIMTLFTAKLLRIDLTKVKTEDNSEGKDEEKKRMMPATEAIP